LTSQLSGNQPPGCCCDGLAPLSDKDPVSGEMPKNPWSKDSLNVTEQMFIAKENPELAEYLKTTKDGGTSTTQTAI
jgi:hypothetical protein